MANRTKTRNAPIVELETKCDDELICHMIIIEAVIIISIAISKHISRIDLELLMSKASISDACSSLMTPRSRDFIINLSVFFIAVLILVCVGCQVG